MFSCLKLSCQFSKDTNIHHDVRRTLRKRSIFWASDIRLLHHDIRPGASIWRNSTKVSQSKDNLKPKEYGGKVTKLVPPTTGGLFPIFRRGVGCLHNPWLSSFVSFSCGVPPKVSGVLWHSPLNTIVSKKTWEHPGFSIMFSDPWLGSVRPSPIE